MRDITKALAKRHKDDMFFTEVKNGPTQTVAHHSRIDALAIKISWTRFRITGVMKSGTLIFQCATNFILPLRLAFATLRKYPTFAAWWL